MPRGPNVTKAEHCVRAKLTLDREIEMLRVRQAVGVPEGHFRVPVQRFERREIKRGIGFCLRSIARNSEGKHLAVRTIYPVIERSLKKLLSAGRPEESKRNVSHFLELA